MPVELEADVGAAGKLEARGPVRPKGELDHPARVYLIDQRGNIREIYSLAFFNEKQALIDIKALLAGSS